MPLEESGQEGMSIPQEMLGPAGGVGAGLLNLCTPLPSRLVGINARLKLDLCIHMIMHTI